MQNELSTQKDDLKPYFKTALLEACCVLERNECKQTLEKHHMSTSDVEIDEYYKAARLLRLLKNCSKSRSEIIFHLKRILCSFEILNVLALAILNLKDTF